MQTIIVYLDDAEHAQHLIAPLLQRSADTPAHWVLVACAPRMTHRISKWVSHSARENWRAKWAGKLFDQVLPRLTAAGVQASPMLAKGPLQSLQAQLLEQYGAHTPILDARRPKQPEQPEPQTAPATTPTPPAVTYKPGRRWGLPGTLASLGLLFLLTAD